MRQSGLLGVKTTNLIFKVGLGVVLIHHPFLPGFYFRSASPWVTAFLIASNEQGFSRKQLTPIRFPALNPSAVGCPVMIMGMISG